MTEAQDVAGGEFRQGRRESALSEYAAATAEEASGELLARLEAAQLNIYLSDSCRPAGLDADLLGRMRRVGASTLTWCVDCGSARLNRLMRTGVSP